MDIFLAALTLTITVPAAALFATVVIGIHRQERAGVLAGPPPGACAVIARKVLALHADPAGYPAPPHPAREPRPATAVTGPSASNRPSAPTGARR